MSNVSAIAYPEFSELTAPIWTQYNLLSQHNIPPSVYTGSSSDEYGIEQVSGYYNWVNSWEPTGLVEIIESKQPDQSKLEDTAKDIFLSTEMESAMQQLLYTMVDKSFEDGSPEQHFAQSLEPPRTYLDFLTHAFKQAGVDNPLLNAAQPETGVMSDKVELHNKVRLEAAQRKFIDKIRKYVDKHKGDKGDL